MIDVMQNKVLGPLVREQIEAGIKAGLVRHERLEAGRVALTIVFRRLAERRYGPLPFWAEVRIAGASAEMLIGRAVALDDSESLESLIGFEY